MKEQLKTPLIVAVAVVALAFAVFMGMRFTNAGNLDQGQTNYTPGTPPWMEKDAAKQGPGGAPGGGTPGAPPGMGAPIVNSRGN